MILHADRQRDDCNQRGKNDHGNQAEDNVADPLGRPLEEAHLVVFNFQERRVVDNRRAAVGQDRLLQLCLAHDVFPVIIADLQQHGLVRFRHLREKNDLRVGDPGLDIRRGIQRAVLDAPLQPVPADLAPQRQLLFPVPQHQQNPPRRMKFEIQVIPHSDEKDDDPGLQHQRQQQVQKIRPEQHQRGVVVLVYVHDFHLQISHQVGDYRPGDHRGNHGF